MTEVVSRKSELPNTFKRTSLEDDSNLAYQMMVSPKTMGRDRSRVLVVAFYGEYGIGSAGAPDAWYMSAIIKAGLDVHHPNGLIIDLSELNYVWGDNLDMVFSPGDLSTIPFAVVLGDRCKDAVGTLLNCADSNQSIFDLDEFFETTDRAIEYLCAKFDEYNRRQEVYDKSYSRKSWGISTAIWKLLKART